VVNFASFDLNLLRVLDALLQEQSTVKAGERVGLSQPAVSNALGRLRHALGDELFVRQGQRLVPTSFAREIASPLRTELERLQLLLSGSGAFDPAQAKLTFRIAGADFFADMLMPKLAARLGETAPGIRVQMVDLLRDSYVGTVDRYFADLSMVPDEPLPDWIESMKLFRSRFVVISRKGHPALRGVKAGAEMPIDTFCSLEHVVFSPEGNLAAMGDAALARIGRTRFVRMWLPGVSVVCGAGGESGLIALVPRQIAERLAPSMGLSIYRPPISVPVPLIIGIWHRRTSADPAHRWMRQQIAEILRPLNEGEEAL
jgi:DNA-binding transcriptional LysR family regulator